MKAIAIVLTLLTLAACEPPPETASAEPEPLDPLPDVGERLARYAPTELAADLSSLTAEDREVLAALLEAARPMDEIFLRQVWRGNPELRDRLAAEGAASDVRTYFELNFGPWDRLDEMEPFLLGKPHPPGAGYYPEDLTREEFEDWLEAHPEDREALTSLVTLVHRDGDRLTTEPYSRAFEPWLVASAVALRRAAAATSNQSLKRFLELRAAAFQSDDYYESDMAWMDLDSPVEITIGPYEVYEDGLFSYKSAFEAFLTVTLPEESAALETYKAELPWLEKNLPIPDEHKNFNRGTESPIRVVDVVFTAGDTKAGVQTLAFNLPNDERVREAKGSKKVLLRNVLRAKYDQILTPIAQRVLTPGQADRISFDAYFGEVLHHELAHGLGPGKITKDGQETEVRLELRELYSTLEEAKADVMGVYDILALGARGDGLIPQVVLDTLEPTYVAGLFRSARFGLHAAHGRGVVSQFNYLLEKGALSIDEEGRFSTVPDKFPGAIEELLAEMLMLQATGDYAATTAFLATYGRATPELEAAIAKLDDVPVDIRPIYPQAEPGALDG